MSSMETTHARAARHRDQGDTNAEQQKVPDVLTEKDAVDQLIKTTRRLLKRHGHDV
jgi:hypothetical protein